MFHFYAPWKRQKTRGIEIIDLCKYIIEVSVFSGSIEKVFIFS